MLCRFSDTGVQDRSLGNFRRQLQGAIQRPEQLVMPSPFLALAFGVLPEPYPKPYKP